MLTQRIITAVFLIAFVLIGLIAFPPLLFAVFASIFLSLAAWEWMNLIKIKGLLTRWLLLFLIVALGIAVTVYSTFSSKLLGLACLWWLATIVLVVKFPAIKKLQDQPIFFKIIMALLTFSPCWVGFNSIRGTDPLMGPIKLLYALAIVWVVDSCAYFAGKKFGKHKLMPNVSPGKSIEGVIGGLLGAVLFVFIVPLRVTMFDSRAVFVLFVIALGIISVFGDLFESVLKRQAGVKDSGKLLPGHGGLLDRLDSTLAIIPFFALFLPSIRF